MSNIERAFLINTEPGTESASVSEINPVVGADMKAHKDDLCKCVQTAGVGEVRQAIPSHVDCDELQEVLAYAAKRPLPVIDLAGGVADEVDPSVIRIPLSNSPGVFALLDAEDYPLVMRYRWRLCGRGCYVVASHGPRGGNSVFMHRLILMVGVASRVVDHKSGDALDNRKTNLRACTNAENMLNQRKHRSNKTGVKGVFRIAKGYRAFYRACVMLNGKSYQAEFPSLEQAAKWVRAKREELHGEFARHE